MPPGTIIDTAFSMQRFAPACAKIRAAWTSCTGCNLIHCLDRSTQWRSRPWRCECRSLRASRYRRFMSSPTIRAVILLSMWLSPFPPAIPKIATDEGRQRPIASATDRRPCPIAAPPPSACVVRIRKEVRPARGSTCRAPSPFLPARCGFSFTRAGRRQSRNWQSWLAYVPSQLSRLA